MRVKSHYRKVNGIPTVVRAYERTVPVDIDERAHAQWQDAIQEGQHMKDNPAT